MMRRLATSAVVFALTASATAQSRYSGTAAAVDHADQIAMASDASAMFALGRRYFEGKEVPRDYVQAADWYRKAATAGSSDAMLNLAILYENGRGVGQDYAQAAAWYEKAARLGQGSAMFHLGVLRWSGRGVAQDYVEAYKWFDLASTSGSAEERQRSLEARDNIARAPQLTPQLIADAQLRAKNWRAGLSASLSGS